MSVDCFRSAYTGIEIERLLGQVASLPEQAGQVIPRFAKFVSVDGQVAFDLGSEPLGGVIMISLNGVIQHDYSCIDTYALLTEACIDDDEVACFWLDAPAS